MSDTGSQQATPVDTIQIAMTQAEVLVAGLKTTYPEVSLSFGYIGNLERWGDDRSWMFFTGYVDPESGTRHTKDCFGRVSTAEVPRMVADAGKGLEHFIRAQHGMPPLEGANWVAHEVIEKAVAAETESGRRYEGRFLGAEDAHIYQHAGKGLIVSHVAQALSGELPRKGRMITVQYDGVGKAVVDGREAKSVEGPSL